MKSQSRLYVVISSETWAKRLVKARSKHSALSHVAKDILGVHAAKLDELYELGLKGVLIEQAGESNLKNPVSEDSE